MEKSAMVERARLYLKLLCEGVHPVSGVPVPNDSALADERVKKCFSFINEVLGEYLTLSERVASLEENKEKNTVVVFKKQDFSITKEQCDSIKLSKEPLTVMSFMKNVNSVIDTGTTERLSSTRINKWLASRGLITSERVQTVVNRTVYKPSDTALKLGIVEEESIDKKSGELKTQLKLSESAQLFIIENLEDIVNNT